MPFLTIELQDESDSSVDSIRAKGINVKSLMLTSRPGSKANEMASIA